MGCGKSRWERGGACVPRCGGVGLEGLSVRGLVIKVCCKGKKLLEVFIPGGLVNLKERLFLENNYCTEG